MTQQTQAILAGLSLMALVGLVFLWLRMPVFRWYCRRCKKIVSSGRFHPAKCTCTTNTLLAYFCRNCGSWDTTPALSWHCLACASKAIILGVEYNFGTGLWRTRNRNVRHSLFDRRAS